MCTPGPLRFSDQPPVDISDSSTSSNFCSQCGASVSSATGLSPIELASGPLPSGLHFSYLPHFLSPLVQALAGSSVYWFSRLPSRSVLFMKQASRPPSRESALPTGCRPPQSSLTTSSSSLHLFSSCTAAHLRSPASTPFRTKAHRTICCFIRFKPANAS